MDGIRRISFVDKMDDYSAGLQYLLEGEGLSHGQQESARQGARGRVITASYATAS